MTNCNRPRRGPGVVHAWFGRAALLLCSLLGFAWSDQASATLGCDIQYNSSSYQVGAPGAVLNYSFDIVDLGGCTGTMSGTITETADTTGQFTPGQTVWSGTAGQTISVSITVGSVHGSTANYTVDCTVGCTGGTQIFWTAQVTNDWELTPTTAQSFKVLEGTPVALGVKYLVDGQPSNLGTSWVVDDPNGFVYSANQPTDSGTGIATNTFQSYVAGTYTVTASGDCPVPLAGPGPAGTTSCPPTPVTFTIVVESASMTPVKPPGGAASIAQNSSIQLKVKYSGPTIPVADGTNVDWDITTEPSAGAGSLTGPNPSQTLNGLTAITFNATVPGDYVIRAFDCPDGCNASTDFTITVLPISNDLAISKTASPNPVAAGGQLTYTINISNNGPDASVNPTWSDNLPASLSFASLTSPQGWRCTTPAAGAGGAINCSKNTLLNGASDSFTLVTNVAANAVSGSTISNTATVGSAGGDTDGSNDSATATVSVSGAVSVLAVVKELVGTVDNDNSGSVSAGDQLDYKVTATNNGSTPLSNVVVSDDHFAATQSCPSLAPAAACVLTGSYIVTAADVTAGQVVNVGTATSTEATGNTSSVITPIVVVEPVTLGVGSGDGQSAPINTPFPQPLTVVAGGAPPPPPAARAKGNLLAAVAPGVTINWSVVSGSASLQSPSSVTNASGIASNNAFAGPVPGPIVIRAARADDPSVTADFHLTATDATPPKLGDLSGLTENQKALADALDEFCSSSTGGGSTPGLAGPSASSASNVADLYARCQELIDAIDTDPSGVIDALEQLLSDLALIQSESSLLAAQSQFDNIKARIAALRSGTNRTSFGGLAFNGSSGRLPIGTMFQSLLDEDKPAGAPQEVGSDFSRWGFFAAGTIGRGDAEAGSLSPSYDFDIDGLTVGADYRFSDKLIFGGTLGMTRQTNDLNGVKAGSLDTDGWSVSGYGTWYQQNSWYMDGVLSYGQNTYDVERHVKYTITGPGGTTTINQTGHAEGDGDSLTFALSVGRDFNKGAWGFGPYLRAMYTKMNFDPMVEEFDSTQPGNGLALALDTRSVTSMTSTLGGKLTYAHSTSWGVVIPHLQLEWQHEFESDPSEVEARFLFDPTGTPFTLHGDEIDTDFFRFGVGMSFVMTHGRSGFFYYERLISRDRFSQNSLALGIRLEF
jgi:outer membrane autotransporter protein/uncharacterized repeat protein (TIGR01451 family)